MKILLLTHTMPRFKADTNSASFISELATSLSKENDVTVLTPYDPLFKKEKRAFKVITYKYIWPNSWHKSGYSRVLSGDKKLPLYMAILSTLMSCSALFHLVYFSFREKYDLVSAHWVIPNGFISFLSSLVTRIPYTVTIPGSDVYLGGKGAFFRVAAGFACGSASFVVSDSRHYLDQLSKLGINPKNTAVIRYGVDTKALKPGRPNSKILSEWGVPKNSKVVMCLGRFVEKKGFIYAINAMPSILKKHKNTTLVLIGDGPLKSLFQRQIKKLKIEKNVFLPGSVPYSERAKYYNLADIFIMPSIKDGEGNIDASPVAMMDAMSCGVPVVATKYAGDKSLLVPNMTGQVVKEKNSKQISDAIVSMLNAGDKKSMYRGVREIAQKNFSLTAAAKSYANIFQNLSR